MVDNVVVVGKDRGRKRWGREERDMIEEDNEGLGCAVKFIVSCW